MPTYYVKYEDWGDGWQQKTEALNARRAAEEFTRELDAEERFVGARHCTPERVEVSRYADMAERVLYIVQCKATYRAARA